MKHGHSKFKGTNSRTYEAWRSMKKRCTNPNYRSYEHYGGRGIAVCERWLNSFENFLSDLGECPDGHTLERKDHNGNYGPANCTWIPSAQQHRNTRANIYVEVDGKKLCLAEACRHFGVVKRSTAQQRYHAGWSALAAVSAPPLRMKP